jgi:hypothetical protein
MTAYITIKINGGAGEADVKFHPSYYDQSDLWKMDVLQDAIADLNKEYKALGGVLFGWEIDDVP